MNEWMFFSVLPLWEKNCGIPFLEVQVGWVTITRWCILSDLVGILNIVYWLNIWWMLWYLDHNNHYLQQYVLHLVFFILHYMWYMSPSLSDCHKAFFINRHNYESCQWMRTKDYELKLKMREGWTCELWVQSSKWWWQSSGVSQAPKPLLTVLWFLFTLLLLLFHSLSFLLHPLFLCQLQLLLHRCEPASSLLLSSCPSRSCVLFQLKAHRHALSYLNSTLVYSRAPFGTSSWAHLPCIRAEAKVLLNIAREEFK